MVASFNVSPMSKKIDLTPGETYEGKIIVNRPSGTEGDFSYQVSVVPYNVEGTDYTIDTTKVTNFSQIANWTKIENPSGSLEPNESEEIKFTINVPADVSGNSQAMALIVIPDSEQGEETGSGVTNIFSIASVVYARVAGETNHAGEVLENNIPTFATILPVYANVLIENTGNAYEVADVTINVTNSITGEKILSSESSGGNQYSEIILPETTREVSRQIDNLPAIGVVHVEQSVVYNGNTSVTSHELFILPMWFILLVILVAIAVIGGIVAIVTHKKKKKVKKSS